MKLKLGFDCTQFSQFSWLSDSPPSVAPILPTATSHAHQQPYDALRTPVFSQLLLTVMEWGGGRCLYMKRAWCVSRSVLRTDFIFYMIPLSVFPNLVVCLQVHIILCIIIISYHMIYYEDIKLNHFALLLMIQPSRPPHVVCPFRPRSKPKQRKVGCIRLRKQKQVNKFCVRKHESKINERLGIQTTLNSFRLLFCFMMSCLLHLST